MKIVVLIARILLGLEFVIFGLNGFLHFIPQPAMPPNDVTTFLKVLMTSGYMVPVFALQVIGGALLLAGRFVPLGLTLLGPIIVNILLIHFLLLPAGIPVAVITALVWLFLVFVYRNYFVPLFTANATPA